MPPLQLSDIQNGLDADPSIFAQNIDFARQAILFLRISRDDFRAASFLDDRILGPHSEGRWVSLSRIDLAAPVARPLPLHFIFHAGHVGSTLISRLIESAGGALALREPQTLRVLSQAFDDAEAPHALISPQQLTALLNWQTSHWRRGFADTAAIVLKATSSAARIGVQLMRAAPESRALYVNLAPQPYLAVLLAGQNSPLDLRGHGPERMRRLARLAAPAPKPLHAMSLGEIAAMTWLVEKLTEIELREATGARVLSIDFDAFLAAPGDALETIFAHFALQSPPDFFAQTAASPVLQAYSKAPGEPYNPQLRTALMAQSREQNRAEISAGMAWLEAMARVSPKAAAALSA